MFEKNYSMSEKNYSTCLKKLQHMSAQKIYSTCLKKKLQHMSEKITAHVWKKKSTAHVWKIYTHVPLGAPYLDEMRFVFVFFPRAELSRTAKLLFTHNDGERNFQLERKLTFFRFFLARTDIISVLNLTRNSPSHHRRFRWDEIIFFRPPNCLELWSFCHA